MNQKSSSCLPISWFISGSENWGYLVAVSLVAAVAFLIAFAVIVKRSRRTRSWSGKRTGPRWFFYRRPKIFLSRSAYQEDRDAYAVGRRTIARRKETNIRLPLAQVRFYFFALPIVSLYFRQIYNCSFYWFFDKICFWKSYFIFSKSTFCWQNAVFVMIFDFVN